MSILSEIIKEFKFNVGYRKSLMSAQKKLDAKAPRAGDIAPDFTLYDIEGKESVTLSDFRGQKPVALVFGSFT
jgi:peroxiredoxin